MAQSDVKIKFSLDSSGVQRGIDRTKRGIKGMARSSIARFARMASVFAGGALVKSISSLGMAAGETASKFNAVFGPAAAGMMKQIEGLKKVIPATTSEMQNALSMFAQMAKGFGLNSEAANKFSVEMVKIAGDVASFHNLPLEEAFGKIQSAVSGEFEPLKQLGIVINETSLKQAALNLKIWDGTGQMSAAQKALAVHAIMLRDMGTANGDAAATSESAANQLKFLKAALKETGEEIGITILPAVETLIKAFSGGLKVVKSFGEGIGEFVGREVFMGGLSDDEYEAKLQLESEGAFDNRKKRQKISELIDERVKRNKRERDAIEEKAAAEEEAAKDKVEALNEEIKTTDDVVGAIKRQIELETDPTRKNELIARLKAYQELLDAAGELNGIIKGDKPNQDVPPDVSKVRSISKSSSESIDEESEIVDGNKKSRFRGGIRTGRISTGKIMTRKNREEALQKMQAGLGMGANGEKLKPGETPASKKEDSKQDEVLEQLKAIVETLTKLDKALKEE